MSDLLQSRAVAAPMGNTLKRLLAAGNTPRFNLLEFGVNPGPSIMRSINEGLRLNDTLRCIAFTGSGMGDKVCV